MYFIRYFIRYYNDYTSFFFLSLICFEIPFFIFLPKIVPTVDGEAYLLEKKKQKDNSCLLIQSDSLSLY